MTSRWDQTDHCVQQALQPAPAVFQPFAIPHQLSFPRPQAELCPSIGSLPYSEVQLHPLCTHPLDFDLDTEKNFNCAAKIFPQGRLPVNDR
jgi:hypothetical protein